jgi:hypothetical protein
MPIISPNLGKGALLIIYIILSDVSWMINCYCSGKLHIIYTRIHAH